MKHKWSVIAILLPLKGHFPSTSYTIQPPETGAHILPAIINSLTLQAPVTLPLSLFKGKKLVLDILAKPKSHQFALFDMTQVNHWLFGRAHMPVITSRQVISVDGMLCNEKVIADIHLPLAEATPELMELFTQKSLPHMVYIGAHGKVMTIIEGQYVGIGHLRQLDRMAQSENSVQQQATYSHLTVNFPKPENKLP